MVDVVPAIIPKRFEDLEEKINQVAPYVKTVQIDIMDGTFVSVRSWPFNADDSEEVFDGEEHLAEFRPLTFELDMMVAKPEQYIDMWSDFGIDTFVIHLGSTSNMQGVIDYIKDKEKGVGIALTPSESIDAIESYIKDVDFVQFMGNDRIGHQGVSLDERALESISGLRARHKEIIISNDIGVSLETAPELARAGANKLVSGSAIYESDDIEGTITKLKDAS